MRRSKLQIALATGVAALVAALAQPAVAAPGVQAQNAAPPVAAAQTATPTTKAPGTTTSSNSTAALSFVGAAHSGPGAQRFKKAAVPAGARARDRAIMVFTHATAVGWTGPSGVTGWTPVSSVTANGLLSTVYSKSLASTDLRKTVRFDASRYAKAMVTVAVYSGGNATAAVTAVARSDRHTTRHTTPATTAARGDWVLSYWVDHRSSTTSWTSVNATSRDTAIGTGRGRYSALLADSAGPSTGGHYARRVATSRGATDAVAWTVRLTAGAATPPPPPPASSVTKLLVIVEENESTAAYDQMPYLKSLSNTQGKATAYTGLVHPSLGNYLAMVSGQGAATCGLRDPLPARCPQQGPTVFGRALAAGRTATVYAESMRSACQRTNSTHYAARHNPWAYFTSERSGCAAHDVLLGTTTSGALRADVDAGTLPNAGMVVPNLINDAHDGSLGRADAWLQSWLPRIMAGPDYLSGRLAVVITFDEGTGANQNIPFVIAHRSLAGQVVSARYTHYGLSRMYTDVLGVAPLGAGATAPGLRGAFGLGTGTPSRPAGPTPQKDRGVRSGRRPCHAARG